MAAPKNEPVENQEEEGQKGQAKAQEGQAKAQEVTIDLEKVNRFRFATAPCLVCKKMKPGEAFGLTPDKAVCADDYTNEPEKSKAALEKVATEDAKKAAIKKGAS